MSEDSQSVGGLIFKLLLIFAVCAALVYIINSWEKKSKSIVTYSSAPISTSGGSTTTSKSTASGADNTPYKSGAYVEAQREKQKKYDLEKRTANVYDTRTGKEIYEDKNKP